MQLIEFIAETVQVTHQGIANAVKDLTPAQLRWRPGPEANSVGFLLFHTFRTNDRYYHYRLTPQGDLWERNKWSTHWRLPPRPANAPSAWITGNSWTPQEVAAFEVPPLEELLAYGEEVHRSGMRILPTLDLSRLSEVIDPQQGAAGTLQGYLRRLYTHAAQHHGQMEYLVGLMQSQGVR